MDWSLIGAFMGTAIAIAFAYRAERSSQASRASAGVAEELAKTDKARQEYVVLLEKQNEFLQKQVETTNAEHSRQVVELTAQITNHAARLHNVEVAETICQQDRVRLMAENSGLLHELDRLRPKTR